MPESAKNQLKGPTFRSKRPPDDRRPTHRYRANAGSAGAEISQVESEFGGISLVGSVRKLVPLCSSFEALSFYAGAHKKEPETTKNDRQTVAIGATSPPVGRPSPPAGTSTSSSIEPVCRPFCAEFAAKNACFALLTFCRCLCDKIRSFS